MPDDSGAIGAACEVPETAATLRVATAIAKAIRFICMFSLARTFVRKAHNTPTQWRFRDTKMNKQSDSSAQYKILLKRKKRLGVVAADLDSIRFGDLG